MCVMGIWFQLRYINTCMHTSKSVNCIICVMHVESGYLYMHLRHAWMHTHTHTHVHTLQILHYIHTCMNARTHTHIYIHTLQIILHTCIHACMHAWMRTCFRIPKTFCISPYNACMHAFMYTTCDLNNIWHTYQNAWKSSKPICPSVFLAHTFSLAFGYVHDAYILHTKLHEQANSGFLRRSVYACIRMYLACAVLLDAFLPPCIHTYTYTNRYTNQLRPASSTSCFPPWLHTHTHTYVRKPEREIIFFITLKNKVCHLWWLMYANQ
jgi:hypothetical protein